MRHPTGLGFAAWRPGRGFTLVELLVTLLIAGVLLAIAVPSMREFVARKRVEGIAGELATDLRYLRSVQIERNRPMGIRFSSSPQMTCYVLFEEGGGRGADCDCAQQPICNAVAGASIELKTVSLPAASGISVTAAPASIRLVGANGMPDANATLVASVSSSLGGEVRVETNQVARPSLCSVSGAHSALAPCAVP